jgi:hypothetical protein
VTDQIETEEIVCEMQADKVYLANNLQISTLIKDLVVCWFYGIKGTVTEDCEA